MAEVTLLLFVVSGIVFVGCGVFFMRVHNSARKDSPSHKVVLSQGSGGRWRWYAYATIGDAKKLVAQSSIRGFESEQLAKEIARRTLAGEIVWEDEA